MNEEKKKSKKRVFTYYLILAACILAIAAVTVSVIFALNRQKAPLTIEKEPEVPVIDVTEPAFINPVATATLKNGHTVGVSLTMGYAEFHNGIDLIAEIGAEVCASRGGIIESITEDIMLDGTTVIIAHDNGMKTLYRFIDVKDGLKEGDEVESGEPIGTIASPTGTEYKEGPHLHFEVFLDNESVDPEDHIDFETK